MARQLCFCVMLLRVFVQVEFLRIYRPAFSQCVLERKRRSVINPNILTCQCWPTNNDLHISAQYGHSMQPRDQPGALVNRNGLRASARERERERGTFMLPARSDDINYIVRYIYKIYE